MSIVKLESLPQQKTLWHCINIQPLSDWVRQKRTRMSQIWMHITIRLAHPIFLQLMLDKLSRPPPFLWRETIISKMGCRPSSYQTRCSLVGSEVTLWINEFALEVQHLQEKTMILFKYEKFEKWSPDNSLLVQKTAKKKSFLLVNVRLSNSVRTLLGKASWDLS